MKIFDRVIGIWVIIAGIELFIFANVIGLYMGTLSGTLLCAVAFPTVVLLTVPAAVSVAFGIAHTAGVITIQVERR